MLNSFMGYIICTASVGKLLEVGLIMQGDWASSDYIAFSISFHCLAVLYLLITCTLNTLK